MRVDYQNIRVSACEERASAGGVPAASYQKSLGGVGNGGPRLRVSSLDYPARSTYRNGAVLVAPWCERAVRPVPAATDGASVLEAGGL